MRKSEPPISREWSQWMWSLGKWLCATREVRPPMSTQKCSPLIPSMTGIQSRWSSTMRLSGLWWTLYCWASMGPSLHTARRATERLSRWKGYETTQKGGVSFRTPLNTFSRTISRSQNQQYLVRASYLEIYQEEIKDLLSKDQSRRLELKERPDTGVYVKDLSSFVTKSVREIEHVMNVGTRTARLAQLTWTSTALALTRSSSSPLSAVSWVLMERTTFGLGNSTCWSGRKWKTDQNWCSGRALERSHQNQPLFVSFGQRHLSAGGWEKHPHPLPWL